MIVGSGKVIEALPYSIYVVVAAIFFTSYLLIAEIPLFALKFKHWGWRGNEVKYIFILSCIPLLLLLQVSGIAVIIAWYVVLSLFTNINKKK